MILFDTNMITELGYRKPHSPLSHVFHQTHVSHSQSYVSLLKTLYRTLLSAHQLFTATTGILYKGSGYELYSGPEEQR